MRSSRSRWPQFQASNADGRAVVCSVRAHLFSLPMKRVLISRRMHKHCNAPAVGSAAAVLIPEASRRALRRRQPLVLVAPRYVCPGCRDLSCLHAFRSCVDWLRTNCCYPLHFSELERCHCIQASTPCPEKVPVYYRL